MSNGSITGITVDGQYLTGTTATLTAVPAAGYVFTGWTGAASGTANPLSLLMDADKTIGATFTRQYTLNTSALANGSITGIAAGGKYLTGTTATLTAVPAAGYAFTGWTGAASGTTNPLSLMMNSDKTIGAAFTRFHPHSSDYQRDFRCHDCGGRKHRSHRIYHLGSDHGGLFPERCGKLEQPRTRAER